MRIIKAITFGLFISLMTASPAAAQTTNQQQTDASAANTVVVNAVAGNPQYAPADQTVKYSGHTYTTPSMGGSVFGGTNPCMIGTGASGAGGPIGFSISLGRSDDGCMRRSEAAAWHALGFDNVAVARLCQDRDAADAFFAATHLACPGTAGDRYRYTDGTPAAEARIAATNGNFTNNPTPTRNGLDLNDPKVAAMIDEAAMKLIRDNPEAAIAMAHHAKEARWAEQAAAREAATVSNPQVQPIPNQ
jgi:hypothetical protein